MNVIFLDVDGVLNSYPYMENTKGLDYINKDNLKILKKIYNLSNFKIVLSSTWRILDINRDMERDMYNHLLENLKSQNIEIIDKTPVLGFNRPLEIRTWLDNNDVQQFLILDDDFDVEDYKEYNLENNLIQTYYFVNNLEDGGLQEKHLILAKEILKNNS